MPCVDGVTYPNRCLAEKTLGPALRSSSGACGDPSLVDIGLFPRVQTIRAGEKAAFDIILTDKLPSSENTIQNKIIATLKQ